MNYKSNIRKSHISVDVNRASHTIKPIYKQEAIIMNKNTMQAGKNVGFERIRRITGYLVGSMDKWNDAKKAEEQDRVKHAMQK